METEYQCYHLYVHSIFLSNIQSFLRIYKHMMGYQHYSRLYVITIEIKHFLIYTNSLMLPWYQMEP
jgi:hypothetical protein